MNKGQKQKILENKKAKYEAMDISKKKELSTMTIVLNSRSTSKLSPIKYFNACLLHYSGKFATNPEYLFFAQLIMEQKNIFDSINIALKYMGSQSQHHK